MWFAGISADPLGQQVASGSKKLFKYSLVLADHGFKGIIYIYIIYIYIN